MPKKALLTVLFFTNQSTTSAVTSFTSLCDIDSLFFTLKWTIPGLFFVYFHLFKQTFQFLQQINVLGFEPTAFGT